MENYNKNNVEEVTSIGQWLLTLIILMIPIINIVFFVIWLFGGGNNKNRTNYCRASIIPLLIVIGLSIIMGVTGTASNWLSNWVNSNQLIQIVTII